MKKIIITKENYATLDGLLTLGMLKDGLRIADFACCDSVELEEFSGTFKVEGKRNGNVYMVERPRRIKGKALFRDDNATLTLGRDGKYYFVFTLPKERVKELPRELIRQARTIARKSMSLVEKK